LAQGVADFLKIALDALVIVFLAVLLFRKIDKISFQHVGCGDLFIRPAPFLKIMYFLMLSCCGAMLLSSRAAHKNLFADYNLLLFLYDMLSVCLLAFAFYTLMQKGIRVKQDGISKEIGLFGFKRVYEVKFDEMIYDVGVALRSNEKVFKIKSESGDTKFGFGLLYARKDMDDLEKMIRKNVKFKNLKPLSS
jgi:hypothetical protein